MTSGAIFGRAKLALTNWLLGMYLLTQSKSGVPGLELRRPLDVSNEAAWRLKHRLLQVIKRA